MPTATPTSVPRDIAIDCIFYDGSLSVEADEYVQIINPTGVAVDLAGWRLTDLDEGYPSLVFPSYLLQPGAAIRVYTNEDHPEWGGFSFGSGNAVWNNAEPDVAGLFDPQGRQVSVKSYPPGCP